MHAVVITDVMRRPPKTRSGARPGFTAVELIIALTVLSIMLGLGLPKLAVARDRAAVRGAKQQVIAYLASARATAIRRGVPAQFHATDNTIWVTATTASAGRDTVGASKPLGSEYAVTLTGTDSLLFDARGFVTNLAATQKFLVTRAEFSDSLCVSRAGLIASRCGF